MRTINFVVKVNRSLVKEGISSSDTKELKFIPINRALSSFKSNTSRSMVLKLFKEKQYFLNNADKKKVKAKRNLMIRRKYERKYAEEI